MTWLRVDDRYDLNDKIVEAGPEAGWLDLRGMLYCARNETDGHIPAAQLKNIGSDFSARKRGSLVEKLVAVGRWSVDPEDGWRVHDYLTYNPAAAKLEAEREASRRRMGRLRSGTRSPHVRANNSPQTAPRNGSHARKVAITHEINELRVKLERDCDTCGGKGFTCTRCAAIKVQIEQLKAQL